MVGDRHSDIAGGRACGVRTIGVAWGYGSRAELTTADPDALIEHPSDLLSLVGLRG
jgi:phosphoglycolate phosphatase